MRRGGENLRQGGVIKKVDSNLFLIIDDLGEERKMKEKKGKEEKKKHSLMLTLSIYV